MNKSEPLKTVYESLNTIDKEAFKIKASFELGISHATFYRKMQNEDEFSQAERQALQQLLIDAAISTIANVEDAIQQLEKQINKSFIRKV